MVAGMIVVSGKTSFPDGLRAYKMIGNISAVQRMILVMQKAGVDRVFLVTSEDTDTLEKHVARMETVMYRNPQTDAEMIDNIRFGLRSMPGRFEKVLIAPVNNPLFSDETIARLINSKSPAAIPVFEGKQGHPVMISAAWFDLVFSYPSKNGLKELFSARKEDVDEIEVEDEGILYNTRSDEEDWDSLADRHSLKNLRPVVRVSLAKDDVFFGPGTQMLMELTDETGAIRTACERMGISYSKGWKSIIHFEKQIGFEVMTRQQGGKHGGASRLTDEGQAFIETYRRFSQEIREFCEESFKKHFPQ